MCTCVPFIAVHAGAGYHSKENKNRYLDVCSKACKKAIETLKNGGSALDGIREAIRMLEDDPVTNAGTGSSLTLDGKVECDASAMDGMTLLHGAVGSLSGIKNPIDVATKLIEEQNKGLLSLGRLPPSMLVGPGAKKWAECNGIQSVDHDKLQTDDSVKMFNSHKRKLEKYESKLAAKKLCTPIEKEYPEDKSKDASRCDLIQDTVGAVAMDVHGNLASGVSSGGISLKHSGRIGPGAVYGAGCWVHNWGSDTDAGVAAATSGSGEHLIRTQFAQSCCKCLQETENATVGISTSFRDHLFKRDVFGNNKQDGQQRLGGVLAIKQEKCNNSYTLELVWGHSTDSMCVGYMSGNNRKPKVHISRLPDGAMSGFSICIEGKSFCV